MYLTGVSSHYSCPAVILRTTGKEDRLSRVPLGRRRGFGGAGRGVTQGETRTARLVAEKRGTTPAIGKSAKSLLTSVPVRAKMSATPEASKGKLGSRRSAPLTDRRPARVGGRFLRSRPGGRGTVWDPGSFLTCSGDGALSWHRDEEGNSRDRVITAPPAFQAIQTPSYECFAG
jgi:hypothetical protein